jgi:hypothetical protein
VFYYFLRLFSCFIQFPGEKFDRIIFNFPHAGGRLKLQVNRALLRDFFISAKDALATGGEVGFSSCVVSCLPLILLSPFVGAYAPVFGPRRHSC